MMKPDLQTLETLYEITRYLNSSLDLAEVLDYVMDQVIKVTGAERGFMMLIDSVTDELIFQVARGMNQQDLDDPAFHVSHTIVREVVKTKEPVLTFDAQTDSRLDDAMSVITKGLRSILCVPIMVRDKVIGLVYVDNRLRKGMFSQSHRYLLSAFASEAGFAIENARLYRVAVDQGRMQRELEMARNIQQGLLPSMFDPIAGYEIAFDWRSAREVAGDFYDCFRFTDDRMGVVIGDVSDKGAAAAIFMAVVRSLFRGNAFSKPLPIDTVQLTNKLLLEDASAGGMFVTLYYAVLEKDGQFLGVNAGHNRPLLYRASDGSIEFLPRGGNPLGWFDHIPLKLSELQLRVGDTLIFYTDGLTEAENNQQAAYGDERLMTVVRESAGQHANQVKQAILHSVNEFCGDAPMFDDLTIVVVRYIGVASDGG
ncbi:MAG: SpoIIE family protein phosphatase [Anaerolineales bacterium]|nr:SpoIIE family protein phosphatase [Anaerolineales bacterium]